MAVNKVVINTENGAETIVDLTGDSVNPAALAQGYTAHDSSGKAIDSSCSSPSPAISTSSASSKPSTTARM